MIYGWLLPLFYHLLQRLQEPGWTAQARGRTERRREKRKNTKATENIQQVEHNEEKFRQVFTMKTIGAEKDRRE